MDDANVASGDSPREKPTSDESSPQTPPPENVDLDAALAEMEASGEMEPDRAERQDETTGSADPAELARQLEDANNRALRLHAELENYRKRVQREIQGERQFAHLPLVNDLLPVIDNLERAIEAAESSDSGSGLLEGVKMVTHQLLQVLQQHHCRPIEAAGAQFDPNLHEAIGQEPSDEYPAGTVTRVARVGYQVHERVVRPSQVFISSGPPPSE